MICKFQFKEEVVIARSSMYLLQLYTSSHHVILRWIFIGSQPTTGTFI